MRMEERTVVESHWTLQFSFSKNCHNNTMVGRGTTPTGKEPRTVAQRQFWGQNGLGKRGKRQGCERALSGRQRAEGQKYWLR